MENPCRRLMLCEIALPHSVVSKCALAWVLYKPSSERKVAREA